MNLRRTATTAGTLAAALALGLATAGSAHAASVSLRSGNSARGGYGIGTVSLDTGTHDVTFLAVCDYGTPDSRRATAEIWRTSDRAYYSYVDAEHGSGTCNDDDTWLPGVIPAGTYTLRVCVRNGATGPFEACASRQFTV
ncbi:hypothetical protein [Streptomyces sp. NPDC053431]|uniref:hypothetical protein n=1 Tax=Streptomyces sp. NPDC053431 TaxID=3365703 RepID=UPI0037D4B220